MTFKFIHTADLHLDSPLRALALRNEALSKQLGTATRVALSRIVDLCISESVDALLIAGDLWDGKFSSTKTPRFVKGEFTRLARAGIMVFLIRGNHDAESRIGAELEAPENTVIFSSKERTRQIAKGDMRIALHGVSMAKAHVAESLLPQYPAPIAGAINIGLMHTSLNGSPDHDPYAPCSLVDLEAFGYDYWALGHIHKRAVHRGNSWVVMAGTPQGRDIGECGETSVTLVTAHPDGRMELEARPVAALRFERLEVSLEGVAEWRDILARMARAIDQIEKTRAEGQHLVLRLRLGGACPLNWRIARDRDLLQDEAMVLAEAREGLWIDKLELQLEAQESLAHSALPAELLALLQEDMHSDPAFSLKLEEAADELLAQLPPELRGLLGESPEEIALTRKALLQEGLEGLLLSLGHEGGE